MIHLERVQWGEIRYESYDVRSRMRDPDHQPWNLPGTTSLSPKETAVSHPPISRRDGHRKPHHNTTSYQ